MNDGQVVPAFESIPEVGHEGRIAPFQKRQRLVGEDHAPSVGGIGSTLLDHQDLVRRSRLFVEEREVQAGRTAAYAENSTVWIVTP